MPRTAPLSVGEQPPVVKPSAAVAVSKAKSNNSKTKRMFTRLWRDPSAASSFSATSISEDDSVLDSLADASPHPILRRSNVVESLPLEVEVIYNTESDEDEPKNGKKQPPNRRLNNKKKPTLKKKRFFEREHCTTTKLKESRFRRGSFLSRRTYLLQESSVQDLSSLVALEHFNKALHHVSNNQLDETMRHVEQGCQMLDDDETNALYWKLRIIEAEVLGRRGEYAASLTAYQRVLELYDDVSTDILASLCFACGRLSAYLRDYMRAMDYYTQELLLTREMSGDSLAVARIYHDLAKLAEKGFGDWTQALVYYEQALAVELVVWKRAKDAKKTNDPKLQQRQEEDLLEAQQQIPETRKCMGRIEFALGNIEEAMRLSSPRFSST